MTSAEYYNLIMKQIEIRAELVKHLSDKGKFNTAEIIRIVNETLPLVYPQNPTGFGSSGV